MPTRASPELVPQRWTSLVNARLRIGPPVWLAAWKPARLLLLWCLAGRQMLDAEEALGRRPPDTQIHLKACKRRRLQRLRQAEQRRIGMPPERQHAERHEQHDLGG